MGLRYAFGPYRESTAPAGSAFSKGDLLMYTVDSSLSRIPATFPSGALICGVALADSTNSIAGLVPFVEANNETVFFASCVTTSSFTPGEKLDFVYVGGRFLVGTSTNSVRCVIVSGGGDTDVRSTGSTVMVRLLSSGLANT